MSIYTDQELAEYHRRSGDRWSTFKNALRVGCFNCKAIEPTTAVSQFADDGDDPYRPICPKCNIDSLLPDDGSNPHFTELLDEMHERYFN